jgi:hypothetical protein
MGNMDKETVYGAGLAVFTILLLMFSICSISNLYTKNKEFKMIYKVQQGEKLSDISRKFKVDKQVISVLNECGEYISEGTALKIPIKID